MNYTSIRQTVLGENPLQFHEKKEYYGYGGSKGNKAFQQKQESDKL